MNKKILLIDDSKTQLHSLKIILTRAGYDVTTADNGINGIEAATRILPDIIISDIMMPNINGYHLCRLLKNDPLTKDIPIILLTILDSKIDKFWGMKAGADKYINKESEPQVLIDATEELIKNLPERTHLEQASNQKIEIDENSYQARINQILDQSLIDSTIMNEFRNLTEFIHDETKLTQEIFTLINSIIDFDIAGIFFNSCDKKKAKILNIDILTANLSEKSLELITKGFFTSLYKEIDKDSYSFKVYDSETSKLNVLEDINTMKTSLIIPIKAEDKIVGGVSIYSHKNIDYENHKTFQIILDELTLLMQIKNLHSQTKLLTIIDPLTNLYNRRYFNEVLEREYSRSKRYGETFSIAMFDIDNFKNLNDTYGHQFGDLVLSEVAEIIISSLRNTDFAFRYGGEEMALILTNSDCEGAYIPIERIRKKIEEKKFPYKDSFVSVTVSSGLSSTKLESQSATELAKQSDIALYKAKESGKNRVIIYEKE